MLGFSCKQISPPSPRTCPKEASGNSTEPGSLGVKQSASRRGDPPRQNSYSDGGGGEQGARAAKCGERSVSHASRPTPVAMAAPPPTPPRSARSPHRTAASHQLRRPPGVPPGFLVCGQRSAERVTSRKDKSPAARTRRLASSGPRPARPRLCRRHVPGRARSLGAAPSPGCALSGLRRAAAGRGRGTPRP